MTPSELRSLGEPFPGWQSRLARCLPSRVPGKNINARTVRRWASGECRIDPIMANLIRQEFELWKIQEAK